MTTKTSAPEIPYLLKTQKVRDWRGLYSAATAGIEEAQRVAYLPLYVGRNGRDEGEQAIAEAVGKATSLKEALDDLQALIDGPPSRVELFNAAMDMKPVTQDFGGMTSYFFRLLKEAKRAEISFDMVILRVLKYIRNGNKFHEDKADDIKANMSEAKCLELFRELQSKLKTGPSSEIGKVKKEPEDTGFVFNIEEEMKENMPQWAQDMRRDLTEVIQQVGMEPAGTSRPEEDDETYA